MKQPSPGRHRGRGALHRVLPLVAWLGTLVAAIGLFTAWGSGPLAAPPLTDPAGWGSWAADRDAVVATVAMLRVLALGLAWYLVGVTTIGAVARIARSASLVRIADALSVPVVRRVLQTSLGLGLATAVVTSSAPGLVPAHAGHARAAPAAAETPTMRALDDETGPAPPGMRPLGPAPSPTSTVPAPPRATPVDAPAEPEPDRADREVPGQDARDRDAGHTEESGRTWTVHAGDHLWSIAERHLGDLLGTSPTDAQVGQYWRRLIEANRNRLVDRDNPDLIVPGQEFVLPEVEVGS